MCQSLQPQPLAVLCENPSAQGGSIQCPIGLYDVCPKVVCYRGQGWRAWFHNDPGGQIGVYHGDSQRLKALRYCRLAAADTAGDAHNQGHVSVFL